MNIAIYFSLFFFPKRTRLDRYNMLDFEPIRGTLHRSRNATHRCMKSDITFSLRDRGGKRVRASRGGTRISKSKKSVSNVDIPDKSLLRVQRSDNIYINIYVLELEPSPMLREKTRTTKYQYWIISLFHLTADLPLSRFPLTIRYLPSLIPHPTSPISHFSSFILHCSSLIDHPTLPHLSPLFLSFLPLETSRLRLKCA